MELKYYKYEGTGNDFIMIDNREQHFDVNNTELIERLCNREKGIGADGFITVENKENYDFKMVYFNSDGNESTMCGNGGRCIIHLANKLGIIENTAFFHAIDGEHEGVFGAEVVKIKMQNVSAVDRRDEVCILNTGSPHYVVNAENIDTLDVVEMGRSIRNNDEFNDEGINVNFIEWNNDRIKIRTYERGVEDETLSCGTGCVAAAIAVAVQTGSEYSTYNIKSKGGELKVQFESNGNDAFSNIWLEGPVKFDHEGNLNG